MIDCFQILSCQDIVIVQILMYLIERVKRRNIEKVNPDLDLGIPGRKDPSLGLDQEIKEEIEADPVTGEEVGVEIDVEAEAEVVKENAEVGTGEAKAETNREVEAKVTEEVG